jgi:hypothetical protein
MAPLYRLPEHHKKALEAGIESELHAGIIVPTTERSLATSHMVPKKDPREFRHVQDLRRRNKDTETLAWPLPPADDIADKVARSQERSKIDLVQSFDQIRVDPSDVAKTAFRAHRGNNLHFISATRMRPQANSNRSTPSSTPLAILSSITWRTSVAVNTRTPYEHFLALWQIFDILRAQKLFANSKKTKLYFPYDEPLNILGVDITPEASKVEAFNALPSPP